MTKEEKIKEIMEMVELAAVKRGARICLNTDIAPDIVLKMARADEKLHMRAIRAKLREYLEDTQ